jgi:peptidoglycan hydrolase CwlO-like protein
MSTQPLFNSNDALLSDMNLFNQKYAKYIYCNRSNNVPISRTCDINDLTCCTADDQNVNNINSLLIKIQSDITSLNLSISTLNSRTAGGSTDNYNRIVEQKKQLESLRNELDNKLMNIYKAKGSEFDDMRIQNNAVTYTSILVTILATTMLFVTFAKL